MTPFRIRDITVFRYPTGTAPEYAAALDAQGRELVETILHRAVLAGDVEIVGLDEDGEMTYRRKAA